MTDNIKATKLESKGLTAAKGFKVSGINCGAKNGKKDIALIYSDAENSTAGVFTQNLVQAAPVHLCRKHLQQNNPIKAIVVNSGNANACNGEAGIKDAEAMAEKTASLLDIQPEQVLVCSTGVIGMPMPMDKIIPGIEEAVTALGEGEENDNDAAEAILTTDTTVKLSAYSCSLPEGDFHIAGMSKGSGMICPNMATMLAFLTTDVTIEQSLLQQLFAEAVDSSFNVITVDGDTSTNDTALIMANGAAQGIEIKVQSSGYEAFKNLLTKVCQELAMKIVEDGEGITKVINITIKGTNSAEEGRIIARSVLNSPLVKTAFYGEDANWGRILAAVGYSGVKFEPDKVDIYVGPYQVAADGGSVPFDEDEMKKVLQEKYVDVLVDLKEGPVSVKAWGTDMTHEYISINADYRS